MMRPRRWLLELALVSAGVCACAVLAQDASPESAVERGRAILAANGITADMYRVERLVLYSSGDGMIWAQPLLHKLPVFGVSSAFHFDAAGALRRNTDGRPFIGGDQIDLTHADVDTTPTVSVRDAKSVFAERARTVGIVDLRGAPAGTIPGSPCAQDPSQVEAQLGLYRPAYNRAAPFTLTWKVSCTEHGYPVAYINARTRSVMDFDSGIRTIGPLGPARPSK